MRFGLAHKLTSYAMVACAYLAVATSGELSPAALVASLAGIAASWWWEQPRIDRGQRAWTAVALVVFAYHALSVLAGADVLLVGAEFLLALLTIKLFMRRAPKDYLHVYVLSFLLLVAGTVLNAELSYGLFFLGYVVTSTWGLILFHLRRETEERLVLRHAGDTAPDSAAVRRLLASRRVVGARFFAGTSVVSLSIFAIASLLFLAIPRIGFGLFFSKSRGGITMAGFSDGVQLGDHGVIKSDTTVVMRVKVEGGRDAPTLHWRGVAFDHYGDGRWRRSPRAPQTSRQVTLRGKNAVHHLLYDQAKLPRAELERRRAAGLRQEIYLEPLGYDVLFGASMPVAFEFESRWRERASGDTNDEIRYPHTAGIKYVVYSDPAEPDPAALRRASGPLPSGFDAYLQLPPEISDRVRALAADITRGEKTAYDKAAALERWLEDNLDYTLQMESPGELEPLDFFLFERRAGHCEYFSSAMAVMARAVGLPSRNVNGFLGGEWNEYDDYVAVRAGDAHSWVEIYFPGHGWVTFDPTPAGAANQLARSGGFLAKLGRFADTLRFKWFQWVIEYDIYRQMRLFRGVGDFFRGGASGAMKKQSKAAKAWLREHRGEATAGVLGAIALVAVIALVRRRRRDSEGIVPARARRRSEVARHYLAASRRLSRRAHRREPSQTPRQHARQLAAEAIPGARELAELTELYYAVTYGSAPDRELAPRARELRAAIEAAPRPGRRAAHS